MPFYCLLRFDSGRRRQPKPHLEGKLHTGWGLMLGELDRSAQRCLGKEGPRPVEMPVFEDSQGVSVAGAGGVGKGKQDTQVTEGVGVGAAPQLTEP